MVNGHFGEKSSGTSGSLDTIGAARYLGLSKTYLDKLRCFGGGPRFAKVGRRVIYRTSDLDVWLEKHMRASTSDDGRSRHEVP
jgi:Helix-turn-helix domain